jgi:hypothetical protein
MTPAAGPDAVSWAAAIVRGLHPLRWGLGLVGLAATVTIAAGLQALWDGGGPRLADWFSDPVTQAQALSSHLAERSFAGLVIRLSVLLVAVAAFWAIIGGWIARHELLARRRGQPYASWERIGPGPTTLVARQLKNLVLCFVAVLSVCALLSLPVVFAGLLNRLGGFGAILVAVVLPVVLVVDLFLLLVAAGTVAWPLMPVTIAAENSDTFDALSRAYNYAYQRPARFALLTVVTLALAALPLAAVLYFLAGPVENWAAVAGHPAVWVAAGLSASIYWSVQTLAYLDLRAAVDATDPNETAHDPGPEAAPAPPIDDKPQRTGLKRAGSPGLGALGHVFLYGVVLVTWFLTAWLFGRFGGQNAGWLGWGIDGHFMPPATGLYFVAAVLAGVWGALWIVLPPVVMLRGAFRRKAESAKEPPAEAAGGAGSAEPLLQ